MTMSIDIEREAYNEQMWESRANGIPTISFDEWKKRNEARRQFFENWKSLVEHPENIAEARVS